MLIKKISRIIRKTSAPFAMVIIDWFIQSLMEIARLPGMYLAGF